MKLSQAKEYLPFVQAAAEGKTIQIYSSDKIWTDCEDTSFFYTPDRYRIKPESKLRPWKPEEVPVGAQVRYKPERSMSAVRYMMVGTTWKGVFFSLPSKDDEVSFEKCLCDFQHSLNNGKTWLPCGVEE